MRAELVEISSPKNQLARKLRRAFSTLLFPLCAVLLVMTLRHFGILTKLELQIFDTYNYLFAAETPSARVLLVNMDDGFEQRYSKLDDVERNRQVLEKVLAANPAVVAWAQYLALSDLANPKWQQLLQDDRVLAPHRGSPERLSDYALKLPDNAVFAHTKLTSTYYIVDFEFVARRIVPGWQQPLADGSTQQTLAISTAAAQLYLAQKQIDLKLSALGELQINNQSFRPIWHTLGEYRGESVSNFGAWLIPMRHWALPRTISASDLLDGKVPASELAGKVIFVTRNSAREGPDANAPALVHSEDDRRYVWAGEVYAWHTDSLIAVGLEQWPVSQPLSDLTILLWLALIALLLQWIEHRWSSNWRGLVAASLALVVIFGLSYYALQLSWWLPTVPAVLVWLSFATRFAYRSVQERRALLDLIELGSDALDAIPEPVIILDRRWRVRFANRSAKLLLLLSAPKRAGGKALMSSKLLQLPAGAKQIVTSAHETFEVDWIGIQQSRSKNHGYVLLADRVRRIAKPQNILQLQDKSSALSDADGEVTLVLIPRTETEHTPRWDWGICHIDEHIDGVVLPLQTESAAIDQVRAAFKLQHFPSTAFAAICCKVSELQSVIAQLRAERIDP